MANSSLNSAANDFRPLLSKILPKIAPKIGARVIVEPEWKIVGQIIFKNGRKRYFRYSSLDLNSLGASDIAKDKDYANFFMASMGYPTVQGRAFFSKRWAKAIGSKRDSDAAYRYARQIGLPVIVKPNSGSQGSNVAKAHTKKEFYQAIGRVFKDDKVALVQKVVTGKDYRIVVLDKQIISAYQRLPLSVMGDGRSTIRQLLAIKQQRFIALGRDTVLDPTDIRIAQKLARQGLTLRSVLSKGQQVYLLDNANLSTGGDAIDVTSKIHPEFKKIAINLTKDMGLRMCGVDLMTSGDISGRPDKYVVLEINAAPGLDHYAQVGRAQEKIVEAMYLKVLKAMQ